MSGYAFVCREAESGSALAVGTILGSELTCQQLAPAFPWSMGFSISSDEQPAEGKSDFWVVQANICC